MQNCDKQEINLHFPYHNLHLNLSHLFPRFFRLSTGIAQMGPVVLLRRPPRRKASLSCRERRLIFQKFRISEGMRPPSSTYALAVFFAFVYNK